MPRSSINVEIPERIRDLVYSDEEIRREVPILLVLKRFRQRLISSSNAASILGLSRRDFLDLLSKEGIAVYDPTDEELAAELNTIKQLGSAKE
jgi:predicted HTH domain antitoxin